MNMIHWACLPFEALSLNELYDCMVLRQDVFVVEQNCPYLDADGKDAAGYHLLGRVKNTGELVAYARILPQGISYPNAVSIGRVVTAQSVRSQGIGKALMQEAIQHTQRLFGNERLYISAQCYLIQFYESFGFQTVGERYLEDDIWHIKMVLKG